MDNIRHGITIPPHFFENEKAHYQLTHVFSENKKTLLVASPYQSKQPDNHYLTPQFIVIDHPKNSTSQVKCIPLPDVMKASLNFEADFITEDYENQNPNQMFFFKKYAITSSVNEAMKRSIFLIDLFSAANEKKATWFYFKLEACSLLLEMIITETENDQLPLLINFVALKHFVKFYFNPDFNPGKNLQYCTTQHTLPLSENWPSAQKNLLSYSPLDYIFSDKYNMLVRTKMLTHSFSNKIIFFIELKDYRDDNEKINAWWVKSISHYVYLPQTKTKDILYFQLINQFCNKKSFLIMLCLKTQSLYQYSEEDSHCKKLSAFPGENMAEAKNEEARTSQFHIIQHGSFYIDLRQGYTLVHQNFFKSHIKKEVAFSNSTIYSTPFGPYFEKVNDKIKVLTYDDYFFPLLVNGYIRKHLTSFIDSICKMILAFTTHSTRFTMPINKQQPTPSHSLEKEIQETPLYQENRLNQPSQEATCFLDSNKIAKPISLGTEQ